MLPSFLEVIKMDSILNSVKKLSGINIEGYEHFDSDLIMFINTVFVILKQLGVGPSEGFSITGEGDSWDDFFGEGRSIEMVKTYMYMKVRKQFDPPTGSHLEALNNMIDECEWRLNVDTENAEFN